jgi:hypothetical protein
LEESYDGTCGKEKRIWSCDDRFRGGKSTLQIGRNKAYAIVKDAYETGAPFRVLMIDSQYRIVTATFFKWLKVLSRKFRKFDCRLVARS